MVSYIIRRLLLTVPTLIGVTLIVFSMIRLIPGDPAIAIAGEHASVEVVTAIRERLGLDRPFIVQYAIFLGNLLRGDLGRSAWTGRPVSTELWGRFRNTLELTGASILIALVVGVLAGIISATRQYSFFDYIAMVGAMMGVSIPIFWLGLMLMLLFAVFLGWLPAMGRGTIAHLVLPAVALSTGSAAIIARMTRSSMLEVFHQDYIRTARAKGVIERLVIFKHAMRNALVPVVTIVGLQFGALLGGAILTETVFAWPGMGRLIVEAIFARDYPLVQGGVLLAAAAFVLVNLVVDLLYSFIDPRIRYN